MNKSNVFLLYIILIISFHFQSIYSQNELEIVGTVYDIEAMVPLQYASVVIDGTTIGVATNIDGDFKIKIPAEYRMNLIKISYIGYKTRYLSTTTRNSGHQMVYLNPLDVSIGEVSIKTKRISAEEIVRKAIWSISDNYEDETNILNCFYREITSRGSKEISVIEAIVDVYKPPYSTIREEDQVRFKNIRLVGGRPASGIGLEGGAYYRVWDDVIANRPGFLDRENLHYYDYQTSRTLGSGDERIIVISFQPDKTAINRELADYLGRYNNVYDKTRLLFSGEIFIRENDYAILKVNCWLKDSQMDYAGKMYLRNVPKGSMLSVYDVRFSYEYRKFKGKYYQYYTNGQLSFKFGNDKTGLSEDYEVFNELLTFDKSNEGVKRFSNKEVASSSELIPVFNEKYSDDYWKDKNIVKAYSKLTQIGKNEVDNIIFADAVENRLSTFRKSKPIETIFLHIDRTRYISGEQILFKAYVIEEATSFPSFLSKSYFVFLVDTTGTVVEKGRYVLSSGKGEGSLNIPNNLSSGRYRIVAYPSFLQNFDPAFCFSQSIIIEDHISFIDEFRNKDVVTLDTTTDLSDIDIQFMPEGGCLVPGVINNIAYTAFSIKGVPIKSTMIIYDENQNEIDTILTNDLGMGSFLFTPEVGIRYYARVTSPLKYKTKNYYLPDQDKNSVAIQVLKCSENMLSFKLTSPSRSVEQLTFLLVQNNEIVYSDEIEFKETFLKDVELETTSTGIATLTIYRRNIPIAERLVFLNGDNRVYVSTGIDYGAYPVKGRMKVKISVSDKEGNPVKAFLSAAIVDSVNCLSNELIYYNIQYAFWLKNNLKGDTPVAIPMSILKSITTEGRDFSKNIDLLLLTFGWRKYSLVNILDNKNLFPHGVLRYYDVITGKIVSKNPNKAHKKPPIAKLDVFEMSSFFTKTITTDKQGNFLFNPKRYLMDKELIWKFSNKRIGKRWRITFNEQEDSLFKNNALQQKLNDRNLAVHEAHSNTPEEINQSILTHYYSIPEVKIVQQRPDRTNESLRIVNSIENLGTVYSGSPDRMSSPPDLLALINSIKPPFRVILVDDDGTPVKYLFYRSPLKSAFEGGGEYRALIVVNDRPVSYDLNDINHITPEMIDKMNIITGPQAHSYFGAKAIGGAILIYTKEPGTYRLGPSGSSDHVTRNPVCNVVKSYYKANYSDENLNTENSDYRLTIHWEPNIETDNKGEAILDYYNAGYNSYVVGVIQGMSNTGEPIFGNFRYKVVANQ